MTTNKTENAHQADLSRVVESKRAAQPKPATLELQRRPRPTSPRKLKTYLQIDRGRKA